MSLQHTCIQLSIILIRSFTIIWQTTAQIIIDVDNIIKEFLKKSNGEFNDIMLLAYRTSIFSIDKIRNTHRESVKGKESVACELYRRDLGVELLTYFTTGEKSDNALSSLFEVLERSNNEEQPDRVIEQYANILIHLMSSLNSDKQIFSKSIVTGFPVSKVTKCNIAVYKNVYTHHTHSRIIWLSTKTVLCLHKLYRKNKHRMQIIINISIRNYSFAVHILFMWRHYTVFVESR